MHTHRPSYVCELCNTSFGSKKDLSTHKLGHVVKDKNVPSTKRKSNEGSSSREEKKMFFSCHICHGLEQFATREKLDLHMQTQHQQDSQDYMRRLPPEVSDNEQAVDAIKAKLNLILRPNIASEHHIQYNFPTSNPTTDELDRHVQYIVQAQRRSFKINVSFGYLLYNTENKEYRVFYAEKNNALLDKPYTISNNQDIEDFKRKLEEMDPIETMERPSTKYRAITILNVIYDVSLLNFVFGQGDLPDYILNKQCIVALQTNGHGMRFADNLCAFRALSVF